MNLRPGNLFTLVCVTILLLCSCRPKDSQINQAGDGAAYDQLISQGYELLKEGKLKEAYVAASEAEASNGKRFEAYALAAIILHQNGADADAKAFMEKAIARVPADKKAKLNGIAEAISRTDAGGQTLAPGNLDAIGALSDSPELKRKLVMLQLILTDADKAANPSDKAPFLNEFLTRSGPVIAKYPNQTNLWLLRAEVAVELDYPNTGWLAARQLKRLGMTDSSDPAVVSILAALDRNGWLDINSPPARDYSKWTVQQAVDAANRGDADAQYSLGFWYANGLSGLAKDDNQAFRWFWQSATNGYEIAQVNVGNSYRFGAGVSHDYSQAIKWYRNAVDFSHYEESACNALAWALATYPDPGLRNGAEAVTLAKMAVSETKHQGQTATQDLLNNLDTLAAAYAETGAFSDAINAETEAISLLTDEAAKSDYRSRLTLYQSNTPYHLK